MVKKLPVNNEIRSEKVRLIDDNSHSQLILTLQEAIQRAVEAELDLVAVSPGSSPPVCKIMNYSHYLYEQSKKEKKVKKHNLNVVKELKMSHKIGDHDYQVRLNAAVKFLNKGFKVKITTYFRGREITHSELGVAVLNRFKMDVGEHAIVEQEPRLTGNIASMFLLPAKFKKVGE